MSDMFFVDQIQDKPKRNMTLNTIKNKFGRIFLVGKSD